MSNVYLSKQVDKINPKVLSSQLSILDNKLPPTGDNDATISPDSAFEDDQDSPDTDNLSDDIDDDK